MTLKQAKKTISQQEKVVFFSGNIGGLSIGSGYSHQKLKAINNIIEAHTGEIIYVEDYHFGTIDKRDSPPSVPIPKYVILNPGDVGPDAP